VGRGVVRGAVGPPCPSTGGPGGAGGNRDSKGGGGGGGPLLLLLLLLARPSTLVNAEASLLLLRGEYATLRAGVRECAASSEHRVKGRGATNATEDSGVQQPNAAEHASSRALVGRRECAFRV